MKTTILYEDQLADGTQPHDFVPHLIVLKTVVDLTSREYFQDLRAYPCKGKEKILTQLPLLRDQRSIIAVLDNDRARELSVDGFPNPRFTANTTADEIQNAFRLKFGNAISVVLLERNMESLVDEVCRLAGKARPATKPTPRERDELLKPALRDSSIRAGLMARMPSFADLVRVAIVHLERR